jgi:hypothetical protein
LYPREEIKQKVTVPIIKKVTKIMKLWDKAKETVIDKYFKYSRKIVGYKEESRVVVLPERIVEKQIITTKQSAYARPIVSKEDRKAQSLKDKALYKYNKEKELKELSLEFSGLINLPSDSKSASEVNIIKDMIRQKQPNKIIKSKIKNTFNGFSGKRINDFLKYLKLNEKYGNTHSND